MTINCINCGCTLEREIDVFGEVGFEMCQSCYLDPDSYEKDTVRILNKMGYSVFHVEHSSVHCIQKSD